MNRQRGDHGSRQGPSFASVTQDVKYALRTLCRSPGFTLVAVLILALGIGANTSIFSLVSAVLLRPLPFEAPERLVVLWADLTARGGPSRVEPTPADYVDWKTRSRSFADMAAMESRTYNLTGDGEPERLVGLRTTANLFSLLGLQPILGRTFTADDEGADATPAVVVSEDLWIRRFGADPDLPGRTIVLDGLARTVIGVVPPDFQFPHGDTAVWVPASFTPDELAERGNYYMYVVARLAAGTTLDRARAEMTTVAQSLQTEYRENDGVGVSVAPLHEQLARDARPALFVLLGAVGLLLLITCSNVANLLLARGAHRRREIALRQALGAARGRLLRQLLTESAVLAGFGVVAGVVASTVAFGYLSRLIPGTFPTGTSPSLDWRVLAFTAGISLLTALLFGAGPALAATRPGFGDALKKGIGAGGAARGARARNALVVAEVALTGVLLVAAGLLLRSYAALLAVDPGFAPQNLLIAETELSPTKYAELSRRTAFYDGVRERVDALPGVVRAGYTNDAPLLFKGGRAYVTIEGQPPPRPQDFARNITSDRVVSPGYFSALGVPLIRGRLFDERDGPDSPRTALINEAMAHKHWPGEDPIGKRFHFGQVSNDDAPWLTVVGVVGDARQMGLDTAPEAEFYMSADQTDGAPPFFWPKHLVVRTQGDPMALAADVRDAVWAVDPDQPVSNVRPMSDVLDAELASRNTQMSLVGGFAALALLLAAVGLYGVLSYAVAQRTSEIGLRMALGAERVDVVGAVLGRALLLAAAGIALSVAAAFVLTRLLGAFLFAVSPTDPATFAGVSALLLLVTIIASYVPARRAANVDPVAALRTE
jgi:putative ABC transport system permease protein